MSWASLAASYAMQMRVIGEGSCKGRRRDSVCEGVHWCARAETSQIGCLECMMIPDLDLGTKTNSLA
jgi:hypothetical protein